jgi:AraC-like DNA-binding protein
MSTENTAETSTCRTRLLESSLGLVESLQVGGPPAPKPRADSYSPDFQVCLPYRGAFVWHVGHDDVVADPNRVLFVTGDEPFRLSRPVRGGYAELIVTVRPDGLADLLGIQERRLPEHAMFRQRSQPASPALQRLGIEFLHRRAACAGDLAADEWLQRFLETALDPGTAPAAVSPSTRRLVDRAKAYMAANLSAPVRLLDIARAVGTTAAYLTAIFRRVEGRPLHQYLVQLRLARALVELPQAADLAALAQDLGFTHHSHFTAVFGRTFGCTPSAYRASLRRDRTHLSALAAAPAAAVDVRA